MSNNLEQPYVRKHEKLPAILRNLPKPNFIRFKVISIGDSEVGKSCLIKRYCEDKFHKYVSTIGVDFGVKKVMLDNSEIRVNFYDLSGHSEFFEVRNEFYQDTQGAILVYDIYNRKSFERLDHWYNEAMKFGAKNITIAVCANKKDAAGGTERGVTEKEGNEWAQNHDCLFFETSAQTGSNVKEMFESLFREMLVNLYGG